jgi:membrane protein
MKVLTRQKTVVFTPKNFKKALLRTRDSIFSGTPAQLAAGVAYFGTLSFFPLLAVLVAVGGMTFNDSQVASIVNGVATYMPKDIASLISTQLQNATANQQANAIVAVFAVGLAIFGVSGAMASIIKAINSIYNLKDERSFIKQQLLSVGLTVLFIVGIALVLPLVFVGGNFLTSLGVPQSAVSAFELLRWVFLVAIAMVGLAVVYHFAPAVERKWRWVSWGSLVATVMWITITAAFFIYLQYFANFSNSYSFFAGIIALMMWINFSALAVLVGADVNKAFEQTLTKK